MNEPESPLLSTCSRWIQRCATNLKIVGVAFLILLLLIPLMQIRSVLAERLGRRNQAVEEITSTWGREQSVVGPVLVVPYRYTVKVWKEQAVAGGRMEKVETLETVTARACFLPDTNTVEGVVEPSRLRRGIYQAVVYTGKLSCLARFSRPDFSSMKIDEKNVLWDEAVVTFAIPDLRGIKESLQLQWGDRSRPLLPGSKLKGFSSGVFARVNDLKESPASIPVRLDFSLNGSGGITFAPVGAQNIIRVSSPWPDPSFYGAFLPAERQVSSDGFKATWQVSLYGRGYAQQWTDQDPSGGLTSESLASSVFGVRFQAGIDSYRNVERAIKYGALFLVLVFTTFFLFEILSKVRIHPFQYTLVGASLCLFYLGLLALSEFIAFGLAYLAAASLTTVLIWFYSLKVLQTGRRTSTLAGLLVTLYGFLYVALQLQDYSLLFGTAGLFLMLTIVIVATRNIDWYARDRA